jgi:hypothetical protein
MGLDFGSRRWSEDTIPAGMALREMVVGVRH